MHITNIKLINEINFFALNCMVLGVLVMYVCMYVWYVRNVIILMH